MIKNDRYLVISDLQVPFEHPKALEFCLRIKKEYGIPKTNILCVGDETDQYFGGQWKKDINAHHTALSEITESKEKFRPWFDAFPVMRLAISNHGTRWQRKALESDIPSILMRRYEDVIGCPKTWRWQDQWLIKTKYPFLMEHGDRFGGRYPHIDALHVNGISTVIGHHHCIGGVSYHNSKGFDYRDSVGISGWGACAGSLIDFKEYAFQYGHKAKKKPILGCIVVIDDGLRAVYVPLDEQEKDALPSNSQKPERCPIY